MTGDAHEVVVHNMHVLSISRGSSDVGPSARSLVYVVLSECDCIGGPGEESNPVVLSIAGCRIGGAAIENVIRDGNCLGWIVSCDDELPSDVLNSAMVDPDMSRTNDCDW